MDPRRGGVLLRYGDGSGGERLGFVPADVARRVTALTARSAVPGLCDPAVAIALADGEVVTVLALPRPIDGAERRIADDWAMPGADRALVCGIGADQRVALTGGRLVATGVFEPDANGAGVVWEGAAVDVLDVRALHRSAEAAIWEQRAKLSRGAKGDA